MGIDWERKTGPKNALNYHRLVALKIDMVSPGIEATFASYEDADHRITLNPQGRPLHWTSTFTREFTREELTEFGFDWEGNIPQQVYKMFKRYAGVPGAKDNMVRLGKRKPIRMADPAEADES